MTKEFIISKWRMVLGYLDSKEARQLVVVAITPVILLAGYYVFIASSGEGMAQNSAVSQTSSQDEQDRSIGSDLTNQKESKDSEAEEENSVEELILVDVSGAVNSPGLKELAAGDRVADAIQSAGGLNVYADKQYIAQALNLAQKLQDGDKLYLPTYYEVSLGLPAPAKLVNKVGDPLPVVVASNSSQESSKSNKTTTEAANTKDDSLVNINTASQAELEELPGIGQKYAEYIISNRPYSSKTDICTAEIVKNSSTCEEIQGLITL